MPVICCKKKALKPPLEYTFEDFEREGATSDRLWRKRQEGLATQRNGERQPE